MTARPDLVAMQLRNEIVQFLRSSVADHGTAIDTGGGMGAEDIHVTVDGVQVHIQIHWPAALNEPMKERQP
jgi:hypothetical protein